MRLQAILLLLPLLSVWYSIGYWTFRILGYQQKKNIDLLLSVMLGFGIIGNIITFMGIFQILRPIWIISLLLVLFISGFFGPYKSLINSKKIEWRNFLNLYRISILFFLLIYFLRALNPPTGIDGLMYHLSVPKLYLQHGGFYSIQWNSQSDLPMLCEMNFLIGIVFKNPILCRLIAFTTCMFLCSMIAKLSMDVLKEKKYIPLSLLIFIAHTNTTANFSQCDVDMLTAAFTLASFWYLTQSINCEKIKSLLSGIIFLCFTVQTKPFGILVVPVALLYIIRIMKTNGKIRWQHVLAAALIPFVAGSIWYIKSMIFKGIPITGMETLQHHATETIASGGTVITLIIGKIILLFKNIISAPWSYSLFPLKHRMDCFGPLFLGILPFAFFIKKNKAFYNLLFWGIGIWSMFIVLSTLRGRHGGLSIRYMTASIAFFSVITVYIFTNLKKGLIKNFILVSIIFAVSISAIVTVKRYRMDIISPVTNKSPHRYLMESYPLYPVIHYINTELQQNCLVKPDFCFGTFYIERPYECAFKRYKDVDTMISDYKARGITHVLANNTLNPETNKKAWFSGEKLKLIFQKNDFYLYKLQ